MFRSLLRIGQSFVIDLDNGFVDTGAFQNANCVGFSLQYDEPNVGPGAPFSFSFTGGGANYHYIEGDAPFDHDSGIPFTGEGLHIIVTVSGPSTSSAKIVSLLSGATTVIGGTLSGSANALQYIRPCCHRQSQGWPERRSRLLRQPHVHRTRTAHHLCSNIRRNQCCHSLCSPSRVAARSPGAR
jgi:hypothetical protein